MPVTFAPGDGAPVGVSPTIYTGSTTWNKPAGVTHVYVECSGSGGSGGNGATGATSGGGGGGGGAAVNSGYFRASDLTSSVSVTVAGTTTTANTTAGTSGTNGGVSSFGSYLQAFG